MAKASTPINAVIFDWAGVFCSPGEPFSHPRLHELTGLSVDEMGKASQPLQQKYYRGEISTEAFWLGIIAQFNLAPLTPAELSAAYLSSYSVYPGMLELAQRVRTKVPTTLLSNLTSEMMDKIMRTLFLDTYFDHVLFSNEIGFMKPEPESFATALARLKTEPKETLFIDDSVTNIEAAKILGMQTMLFTTPEACTQLLNSLVDFSA